MSNKKYLLLISVILFFGFVLFSYLVAKERFTQTDFDLTVKFQDHLPRKWDTPFSLLSYFGSAEVTGIIWILLCIYVLIRRFFWTFFGMLLLPLALGLELFGKIFVFHPAPPYYFYRGVFKFNFPSSFVHTDYSYPSGHLTRTAFLANFLIVYFILRKPLQTQIIAIPILIMVVILMAVSRIYLGEHWSSDVLGGILIGTSTGILCGVTLPQKKRLEPADPGAL